MNSRVLSASTDACMRAPCSRPIQIMQSDDVTVFVKPRHLRGVYWCICIPMTTDSGRRSGRTWHGTDAEAGIYLYPKNDSTTTSCSCYHGKTQRGRSLPAAARWHTDRCKHTSLCLSGGDLVDLLFLLDLLRSLNALNSERYHQSSKREHE